MEYCKAYKLFVMVMVYNVIIHYAIICLLWLPKTYIEHICLIVIINLETL